MGRGGEGDECSNKCLPYAGELAHCTIFCHPRTKIVGPCNAQLSSMLTTITNNLNKVH